MANSNSKGKPNSQTGAMTLVLLVQKYKSQMIALLLKNGVIVPKGASDKKIAMLMFNLLKISKSFANDLNAFISNPKVLETLAGGLIQTAQYFRMSGKPYMNVGGGTYDFDTDFPEFQYESQYGLDFGSTSDTPVSNTNTNTNTTTSTSSTSASDVSWWTGIKQNLGNYISDGIKLFGTISTNNANVDIANAQSAIAQAQSGGGGNTYVNTESKDTKDDEGMSTTTIVVLSLVGVAVLGAVIYFATRPKE